MLQKSRFMSKNLDLKTALIVTTYNKPELLELVLETALRQKVAPYEIIVADDGSKEETEQIVRKAAKESTVTIKHVWQEDQGFRLNRSRNNAIAVAESEYITLIDGDCFVGEWFIHDHIFFARPGRLVLGRRVNVLKETQKRILQTRNTKVNFFTRGATWKSASIRSLALARLLSAYQPDKSKDASVSSKWRWDGAFGANMAFFRDDALRVNGFNELWSHYGDDDLEFCVRLERNGVRRFKVRHYATNYHFHHDVHFGVVSEDKMLTPTSPEYLASVNKTQTRCVDAFGLTRALSQKSDPVVVEGRYEKYLF